MAGSESARLLGVLNVSPESMVEDSIALSEGEIRDRAKLLVGTGADWIDLGGRSITPDAPMIDDREEQRRVLPALELLSKEFAETPVSVDTWSAETALAALDHGASGINFTARTIPKTLLDEAACRDAWLFMTFMPYENAYAMRTARPAPVGIQLILDHLGPKVDAARAAGCTKLAIDPNLGIIHPSTSDARKIHQQLEIVWHLDRLRELRCPILLYAARKPERLARIMMASAILHAGPDFIRTHDPASIEELRAALVQSD